MKGCLITLEGGEGAGKSTVLAAMREQLVASNYTVVQTREPGGTPLGEALRTVVLDAHYRGMCAQSELLLMFAARAELVHAVITPALAAGQWVLSDRFTDASFAYQGGGRGQPQERIASLAQWTTAGLQPDLTLLLDLPVQQGLARMHGRGPADRIEMETANFFERVRAAYRALAAAEPQRFRIIDASQPLDHVLAAARTTLAEFLQSQVPPL